MLIHCHVLIDLEILSTIIIALFVWFEVHGFPESRIHRLKSLSVTSFPFTMRTLSRSTPLFCCVGLAGALNPCTNNLNSAAFLDAQEFASLDFDYLVVGGGTAGLTVASRLSENSKILVGVIEAGDLHVKDSLVDVPAYIGLAAGNPAYDWNLVTVPQESIGGRVMQATRGKILGGSSALNFLAWTRAPKDEYDSWNSFGPSAGWTWQGLLPFFKKSASVFLPQMNPFAGSDDSAEGFDPEYVGFNGPINTSFNEFYPDPVPVYFNTLTSMGISINADPESGNTTGLSNCRSSIDRTTGSRSYAVTGYHCLAAPRKNYRVLVNAQATRIVFNSTSGKYIKATGVEFNSSFGILTAKVKKEVILSAGAYKTPHLLELSGIGNQTLLARLGVQSVVNLPSVGENLQDHYSVLGQYQLKPGFLTFDELSKNATFATEQAVLYNETRSGMLAASNSMVAFLPIQSYANESEIQSLLSRLDASTRTPRSALQSAQYAIQRDWLRTGSVPATELLLFSGSLGVTPEDQRFITIAAAGLHHLSRGSVHINSSDPLSPPQIDPKWLSNDYDVQFMLRAMKFVLQIGNTSPLVDIIQARSLPAMDAETDTELIEYIKSTGGSSQHPMGTAAMAPRDMGGVVDSTLKVYGTSNLRVCDASIFPTSLGTHLQATVYAIAEKLADQLV
ncbi:Choline dehydrogenase [Termitomyces sp. T112]|nr:Choline dehydrogenase [Termitomyces sp. T112]